MGEHEKAQQVKELFAMADEAEQRLGLTDEEKRIVEAISKLTLALVLKGECTSAQAFEIVTASVKNPTAFAKYCQAPGASTP